MTVAQNITKALGGDWHGSYGSLPAPGHSKADRGVTVKDADDGDVVFNSFNGADWRALKDECRQRGLLPDRDQHQLATWRETGSYEYVGADGTVAYRTVRKEKPGDRKRFVAQRPNGRGGWVDGLSDAGRIPYRLPDILAANPATVVYLAEGERKADKLASWSLIATAVAFGAKGWRDSYAAALAGRTVAILPDNDDVGRAFAEKAAAGINAEGGRTVIVTLPGLPEGGDVMDWTGTADELRALTASALRKPVETFELADLSLWANTVPTTKAFVMAPFIPRDDVVIVTGDGGTNKSTAALQISACAAAGKPMLGMDVAPGPALYITAEDDQRENHWRLSKIAATIGTTLHDLAGRLHIVSLRGRLNNELATFDVDGKLRPTPAYTLLRATIEATKAKLVTLDNVAHLFAGNENDRSQVTAFINLLYQLCGELGVTILLIAHRNKAGDSYSGSTAWLNAVRSQILLERSDENDADVRTMSLGKANYARAGEQVTFRWHDFALVRDADLPSEFRAEIAAVAADNAANERYLKCLAATTERRQAVSHVKGTNYAPRAFAAMAEADRMSVAAFERAQERLLYLRLIRLDQPLWQDAHRHWKQGIKLASECGDPPAATPCGDLRPPPNQPVENTAAALRAATPLNPTGKPGAAHGVAAPSRDDGSNGLTPPLLTVEHPNGRPRSGMILAPEDTEDDGNGGLEGWSS